MLVSSTDAFLGCSMDILASTGTVKKIGADAGLLRLLFQLLPLQPEVQL